QPSAVDGCRAASVCVSRAAAGLRSERHEGAHGTARPLRRTRASTVARGPSRRDAAAARDRRGVPSLDRAALIYSTAARHGLTTFPPLGDLCVLGGLSTYPCQSSASAGQPGRSAVVGHDRLVRPGRRVNRVDDRDTLAALAAVARRTRLVRDRRGE